LKHKAKAEARPAALEKGYPISRAKGRIVKGLPLTATFAWREKEGAAFPGVTGRLSIARR